MTINTAPLVKALLWAGLEDYCALWQAVWEIGALVPDLSEEARRDQTRLLVQTLVDQGAIELVSVQWSAIEPTDPAMARQLLAQPDVWVPKGEHDRELCFMTTEAGEQRYAALG